MNNKSEYLKHEIVSTLRQVLLDPSLDIHDDKSILDYGLDSLIAMDFIQKLNRKLELQLTVDLVYQYPIFKDFYNLIDQNKNSTPALPKIKLSLPKEDYASNYQLKMRDEKIVLQPTIPVESQPSMSDVKITNNDIAIIGLGMRLPRVNNLDEFWHIISNAQTVVDEVPSERWNHVDAKVYCKAGGFIDNHDHFDEEFFGISPREAQSMDPQSRLLLEVAWHALEDAGVVNEIDGSDTGVFIGSCFNDYAHKLKQGGDVDHQYFITGNSNSYLANRMTYHFNLLGPSLTLDTSCSSGVVALHYACQSLIQKECNMAVVGAANICLVPDKYISFCEMNALSQTGCMRPFDIKADGYVPAEGVVVFVLKPLAQASADRDKIYGVIKSSAVCSGGRSGGATVPNVNQEQAVIEKAWKKANISPEKIQYIETHGTSTNIGDPLEYKAIFNAIKSQTQLENFCYIGSSKANFGHTEATSGLVGILKVLAQYKFNKISALAAFEQKNNLLESNLTPLIIPTENIDWVASHQPRISGINSFGMGGTLAHVVVEDFKIEDPGAPSLPYYFFPFSAKSMTTLKVQLQNMLTYLQNNSTEVSGYDLSYCLTMKRRHFNYRVAFVAHSLSELENVLVEYIKEFDDCMPKSIQEYKKERLSLFSVAAFQTNLQDLCELLVLDAVKYEAQFKQLIYSFVELYCLGYQIPLDQLFSIKRTMLVLPNYPFNHIKSLDESPLLSEDALLTMSDEQLYEFLDDQIGCN